MNEADTCRTLVRPRLEAAGWDGDKHFYSEQTFFTDGRIVVPAGKPRRLNRKFTDFLLRYSRDITLAVVEAKSDRRPAGNGLQQAKQYAEILGLKFAYATNGTQIIEYDFFTGQETELDALPLPAGRKNCTKTAPLQYEEFAECLAWWPKRQETERAWRVPVEKILENNCNLDLKNPNAADDFEHLPPEQLVDDILQEELRIAEIMREIKELLKEKP